MRRFSVTCRVAPLSPAHSHIEQQTSRQRRSRDERDATHLERRRRWRADHQLGAACADDRYRRSVGREARLRPEVSADPRLALDARCGSSSLVLERGLAVMSSRRRNPRHEQPFVIWPKAILNNAYRGTCAYTCPCCGLTITVTRPTRPMHSSAARGRYSQEIRMQVLWDACCPHCCAWWSETVKRAATGPTSERKT
jgi:hypothetical protein